MTAAGHDVHLSLNRALGLEVGQTTQVVDRTYLPTLDWRTTPEVLGPMSAPVAKLDFSGPLLQASGAFELQIGDTFGASGDLLFAQGRRTVTVGQ